MSLLNIRYKAGFRAIKGEDFQAVINAVNDLAAGTQAVTQLEVGSTTLTEAELAVLDAAAATNAGTGKAMILGTSGAVTIAGIATFSVAPLLPSAGLSANGSAVTSAELAVLGSATNANAGTGKALITGTSGALTVAGVATFGANPTFAAGKTLDLDSTTQSLTSNAATITKYAAQITSEALTTAAGSSQAFVITLTGVAATDLAFVQAAGGTNSREHIVYKAICTSNTITVTVSNIGPTNAINGTVIFNLWVVKA